MTAAQKNRAFLAATDAKTRDAILSNIAAHYAITAAEARAEVEDDDAEHLIEYVTGPNRSAYYLLMQRRGLA